MTNHFHLLLEVPPSDGKHGSTEDELIRRLGGLYSRAYVNGGKKELAAAHLIAGGKREGFPPQTKQKKELARLEEEQTRDLKIAKVVR